jgi:hypothetical protein
VQADDYIAIGLHKLEIGVLEDYPDLEDGAEVVSAVELRKRLRYQIMQAKAVRYSLKTRLGRHIRAEGV